MTGARMALPELIEKRGDTDPVRELLASAAERLMAVEVEVEGLGRAGHAASARRRARTTATAAARGPRTRAPAGATSR